METKEPVTLDAMFSVHDPAEDRTYVCVRDGQVVRTSELVPGELWADYDANGKLLGIEVLRCT